MFHNLLLLNVPKKVRVINEVSNEFKVSSGDPQGSLLSPLLFLNLINDIPDICKKMIPLLFADDAKFLSIRLKPESNQDDLNQLFEWTTLSKLPLNVEECAHLEFTNRQQRCQFQPNSNSWRFDSNSNS